MQNAETVLGVLRERGRRGLPLEELYRQLFNPQMYLLAYGRVYSNLQDLHVLSYVDQAPYRAQIKGTRNLQVRGHNGVEHPLSVADHDQLGGGADQPRIGGGLGVVEQDLRAVGIEAPAGRACARPNWASSCSRAGRMRCSGTPLRRIAVNTTPSASPMNGMTGPRTPGRGSVVRIGAPTTSRCPRGWRR